MNKLQISSGLKRIEITDENNDLKGILEFNPLRIDFIERYQSLLINFKKRSLEAEVYLASIYDIEDDNAGKMSIEDDRKISDEVLKEINKLYDFVDEEIDALFGAGSSAMLFSKERDIGEYDQFLEGIGPYVQKERTKKTDPYSARKKSKKASKRTKSK